MESPFGRFCAEVRSHYCRLSCSEARMLQTSLRLEGFGLVGVSALTWLRVQRSAEVHADVGEALAATPSF